MPGRRDEITKRWCFDSVQEFWDSKVLGFSPASVQQGSFVGQVLKGIVDNGRLRELRKEDVESGIRPDTLIVSQVLNLERNWNWDRLQNPHPERACFHRSWTRLKELPPWLGADTSG